MSSVEYTRDEDGPADFEHPMDVEEIVLDWLGKLLALPPSFLSSDTDGRAGKGGGVILSTASEAVLVCMLAARARVMVGRPAEDQTRLVVYTSDQGHSCIQKACMIADVVHCHLVANRLGIWCHVDAAYAGSMAVCPELRGAFDGLELADSFNMNPTKSLLVNWECSALWVQDAAPLRMALSLTPEYLRAKNNLLDLKDWQVPLGTRFRAMKLWFVLRSYGAQRLRVYIRHRLHLARRFAAHVRDDERFELAAGPKFGLVCMRLKGASREQNSALLEALNASGKLFMGHTELAGRPQAMPG
ncbi:hypothetical protein WJX72_009518 [[Myrmecia] bisecta]|uniref:Dopa decarboxylase n=1 Tax=[Myrmecia] bisecta TaxID=41462 RepID=A0AAW1P8T1_9CHLO